MARSIRLLGWVAVVAMFVGFAGSTTARAQAVKFDHACTGGVDRATFATTDQMGIQLEWKFTVLPGSGGTGDGAHTANGTLHFEFSVDSVFIPTRLTEELVTGSQKVELDLRGRNSSGDTTAAKIVESGSTIRMNGKHGLENRVREKLLASGFVQKDERIEIRDGAQYTINSKCTVDHRAGPVATAEVGNTPTVLTLVAEAKTLPALDGQGLGPEPLSYDAP